jgi:hypothetical protein
MNEHDSLKWLQERTDEYCLNKNDMGEVVDDFDDLGKLGQGFSSVDELEEVDIGDGKVPRPTFVSAKLIAGDLLREFRDCFAWDYTEMPRLSRELVEHRLPIKHGFRSHKQPPRRFNHDIHDRVKEEVDRLLKANFIRPCRYAEWVSNIVPVEKKNTGKIRICVDFRDLNRATPKDEYPMPIADELVNQASGNKIISFLDGNAGYNQIFMAEEDVSKTAFRCPGFVGLFEWVVMTFGLRNAGATYQRAMNLIFHDLLGIILEIYIDDVVVKSAGFDDHIADLRLALERMRKYDLKMNPLKCAFGVSAGRFLGFIVHEHGIEIDPKKVEAIGKLEEPTCKRDVQKLLGKINYLRRFISNLARKVESFTPLVRLKHESDFRWGAEQRVAFTAIKKYLLTLPVLKASKAGVPSDCILQQERVIGAVLIQEHSGKESVVAYLSRRLLDSESRYAFIEKLCLSLYFVCTKFRHYLLLSTCTVVCQTDVIKYMLQKPIPSGRVGKWAYALIEYDLIYESLSSMKGQVIADFINDHRVDVEQEISCLNTCPWQLFFDGSVCKEGQGIGYVWCHQMV